MNRLAIDIRMIGSGGIGSFISELLPHFIAHYEKCLLIGSKNQAQVFLSNPKVEFLECEIKTFSLKEMLFFPKDMLKKINSCDAYFTPYCNIPNGIKIPVYCTIHDIVFLDVDVLTGTLGRLARKIIYQRAINKSKEIFTVSNFSKERIQKQLHCKKPLTVIYNSAPSYLLDSLDSTGEKPQKEDIILFVGNIKKHKGLPTLLKAFSLAREKGLKSKLVIVGNKDNFRTGDQEVTEYFDKNNDDSIEFTGKISNAELKKLYQKSRVLVQPSLYEGFGMPPLEAMMCGTPAIISDIPVFKEIYGDFPVTFFHVQDFNDLADKLVQDVELDSKTRVRLSERYSYKNSAQTIMDAISKV
ncbi:MAG TPA: glycosyltransferase family 1 protein [Treponema sp.]|nr:glycosyltransferase family 1 protein [Treponema sp.]